MSHAAALRNALLTSLRKLSMYWIAPDPIWYRWVQSKCNRAVAFTFDVEAIEGFEEWFNLPVDQILIWSVEQPRLHFDFQFQRGLNCLLSDSSLVSFLAAVFLNFGAAFFVVVFVGGVFSFFFGPYSQTQNDTTSEIIRTGRNLNFCYL